ncbi:hypothetical protein HW532_05970 [Kaustia mangrovi]|uniref:Aldehyde dehydrogenase n=1 Tax=Kaustia mangrovi TaxID=2593653 RepID=A0A7S8C2P7_9HYPH|nr:hypothetical protein [Kaustia mangrovi]QPC42289.1 hypothetical protein HW532_05970 [Kaustia mangrovi]
MRTLKGRIARGGPLLAVAALLVSTAAAGADELGSDWPEGPGREDVGYFCSACHSLAIVKQQGLTRGQWDEMFDWMVEEQGMPELEGEMREEFLDYLSENFGPDDRGEPQMSTRPQPLQPQK